jgi:hypothetical protein
MKKSAKPSSAADPARRQAVIYARVSSKEQEKEGFFQPLSSHPPAQSNIGYAFVCLKDHVEDRVRRAK